MAVPDFRTMDLVQRKQTVEAYEAWAKDPKLHRQLVNRAMARAFPLSPPVASTYTIPEKFVRSAAAISTEDTKSSTTLFPFTDSTSSKR